jgi:hypothetical protein
MIIALFDRWRFILRDKVVRLYWSYGAYAMDNWTSNTMSGSHEGVLSSKYRPLMFLLGVDGARKGL